MATELGPFRVVLYLQDRDVIDATMTNEGWKCKSPRLRDLLNKCYNPQSIIDSQDWRSLRVLESTLAGFAKEAAILLNAEVVGVDGLFHSLILSHSAVEEYKMQQAKMRRPPRPPSLLDRYPIIQRNRYVFLGLVALALWMSWSLFYNQVWNKPPQFRGREWTFVDWPAGSRTGVVALSCVDRGCEIKLYSESTCESKSVKAYTWCKVLDRTGGYPSALLVKCQYRPHLFSDWRTVDGWLTHTSTSDH